MKNRKTFSSAILLMIILSLFTGNLVAGDKARIGTTAGQQVLIPVGARGLAMGGADLANTSGLNAIFWNPAGLSVLKNVAAAQISSMAIFDDVRVNNLALGFRSESIGVIGVSIKIFDFGDIPITTVEDMDGASGQLFSPTFATIGLTYSRRLSDRIQVGATGKLIYESIPRASASAFGIDFGIQYKNLVRVNGLNMGLAVKNLGTDMQYGGAAFLDQSRDLNAQFNDFRTKPVTSNQLPSTVELGLSYQRPIMENSNLIVSGIFMHHNTSNNQIKFGAEYGFNDLLFLRCGYVNTPNMDSEAELYTFSFGFGVHLNLGGTDVTLDYAYRNVRQYYSGNNMFSFNIGF